MCPQAAALSEAGAQAQAQRDAADAARRQLDRGAAELQAVRDAAASVKRELAEELDAANELRRALGAETARAEGLERERNRAKRAQEASDKKAARWRGSCEELEDRVLQLEARIRTFSERSSTL